MNDQFHLAVDVGTSRVAAATARLAADGSIVTTPVPLGRRSDNIATVVFVAEDGELLVGDAAERRGVSQPERLVREFKRSIGDDIPLVVSGRSIRAERLYAHTVAWVVDLVTEREGARPASIMLTHPATWGPHRIGLIQAALEKAGVGEVDLISEPEAAARSYEFARPLAIGETLAVYDLGGGTFDSVVLRKDDHDEFVLVGEAVGIDNLGGADFDDAVLRHVLASVQVGDIDPADPDSRLALAQLRRECVDAKEALSFDSDATIPVLLPSGSSRIRLTRSEFESMIDPSLERTINALDDALEAGGVDSDEVECILLIGGSSRIPLVTQRLSERFDRPTAIDADPKSSIALGAALTALVRYNDQHLGVGHAVAMLDPVDNAAALELFQPAGAVASPAAPKNAMPTKTSARHTLAVAGGAVLIAGTIVFGSTWAAGSGALYSPTSSVKPLVDWSQQSPAAAQPAPAAPPAAIADPAAAPPEQTTETWTSPVSRRAPQRTTTETTTVKTISDPPSKAPSRPTSANPSTPTQNPSSPSPSPSPSESTPTTPTETEPTTEPTTPPVDPTTEPTTDPTTPPVEPTTEPTTPPVEPTTEPTTDPTTEPTTPPPAEPEPTGSPSPDIVS